MLKAFSVVLFLFVGDIYAQTFKEKHEQMLYPVVRVRTGKAAGSGTVLWSKKEDSVVWTYVMTNHHVISSAISVKDVWNPLMGRNIKQEFRSTVAVEYFKYNSFSKNVGVHGVQADIVAYDAKGDLALLKTRDVENVAPHVAKMMSVDDLREIKIYDELYAVGASLGHAPISTKGMLNFMDDEIDDLSYWLSSAQIIYGNSGGAIFRWSGERVCFEWLGVPSRVSVAGWGTPITHMGYFIPPSRVVNFLKENYFRFIYSDKYTRKDEEKKKGKEVEMRKKALELKELWKE